VSKETAPGGGELDLRLMLWGQQRSVQWRQCFGGL